MFCPSRFSTSFSYYGLSMDLQKFGVNIYLIQVIFGAVDIPAKIIITVAMSMIGRRLSQCVSLVLSGITILANGLVPYGKYANTVMLTCYSGIYKSVAMMLWLEKACWKCYAFFLFHSSPFLTCNIHTHEEDYCVTLGNNALL